MLTWIAFFLIGIFILSEYPLPYLYTIKKNRHTSTPFSFKLFSLLKPKEIVFNVEFFNNTKYSFEDIDQKDINKLFGIGFFPHHHFNSARFGWRYNLEKDKIEILSYTYSNKKRIIPKVNEEEVVLADLEFNTEYFLKIKIENCSYTYSVYKGTRQIGTMIRVERGTRRFMGYFLQPYFGGQKKAPHEMNIKLIRIS